ncbi:MAG: T9SS type A sorting domain-containing protein [Bacteroidetes bacterium]|nr:T9SS type A sorting domain-containing protein [Bacteroidota bacterium]
MNNSGTAAERVQAQRAYFNFVLLTGKQKRLAVSTTAPASFASGFSYPVSASVTSGTAPYTYQWTSTVGGTFTGGNTANAVYTAPFSLVDTIANIRIRVTDACGRVNIKLICVPINASPLPIDLLSFTAVPKKDAVKAEWCTASEINNDYFSLERSEDARSFESIATIEGKGNSTIKRDYSFLDRSPLAGLSYYRLKQTDFDGQFSYSEIVPVKFNGSGFVVFPNPAYNNVTILVDQTREDKISVQLVDFSGRIVYLRTINFKAANSNKFELDVSTFARGIYRLICTSETATFVEPLVLHE